MKTHSYEFITAKVHDRECLPLLLHGEESAVFGDKAYASGTDKNKAREATFFGEF